MNEQQFDGGRRRGVRASFCARPPRHRPSTPPAAQGPHSEEGLWQAVCYWFPVFWIAIGCIAAVQIKGAGPLRLILALGVPVWALRRWFEWSGWPGACEILSHVFFSAFWVVLFIAGPAAWNELNATNRPAASVGDVSLDVARSNFGVVIFIGLFTLALQSRLMDARALPAPRHHVLGNWCSVHWRLVFAGTTVACLCLSAIPAAVSAPPTARTTVTYKAAGR